MSDKKLIPNKPCADYPSVKQCSIRCMNCRWNEYHGKNVQYCKPHSADSAKRKGEPQEAAPDHLKKWMDKVQEHELERFRENKRLELERLERMKENQKMK